MGNNQPLSNSICAGLLAALCFSVAADPEQEHHPILVEAFGFGIPEAGKPEAELRQEAIEDALGNAEMQSYVGVDLQVCVEDMRIKEKIMRLSSLGSVELLRILEAGYMPNSTPPLYRVHVEARVYPQTKTPSEAAGQPLLATLTVQSRPDPKRGEKLHPIFVSYLEDSGIQIVESPAQPGTVAMNISLVQLTGHSAMELQWVVERRSVSGTSESFATNRILGSRLVPLPEDLPMELQRLGTLLAQEVERVSSP